MEGEHVQKKWLEQVFTGVLDSGSLIFYDLESLLEKPSSDYNDEQVTAVKGEELRKKLKATLNNN